MTPTLRGLAWLWTGLLSTGAACAGGLSLLGAPQPAVQAVAPPGVLEAAAVAHAVIPPPDPIAIADASMPVPPLPPLRVPPAPRPRPPVRRHAPVRVAAFRWHNRPPPPLRVPALRQAYPAPAREGYEYFPGYGYYIVRY